MGKLSLGINDIGIGGALSLSCVVREVKRVSQVDIDLYSYHPSLFINNPLIVSSKYFTDDPSRVLSTPPMLEQDRDKHYNYYYCKDIGIEPIDIHPEMYITSYEKSHVRMIYDLPKEYIVLHAQPSNIHYELGKTTRWTNTKDWYPERWEEVVKKMKMPVLQVRTKEEPYIHGCIDTLGTSIIQACAIIAQAQLLIGCVSYSMHVAAATGTKAVVLYGGREFPTQTGYPKRHMLLYSSMDCSPCYKTECEYRRVCMEKINVAHVTSAAEKALQGKVGMVSI